RCRTGYSLENHFYDHFRRGNQGGVVDLRRSSLRTHPSRQEQLGGRVDHAVFLSNEIPRGPCPPRRPRRLLLNTRDANGTLRCCEQCRLFRGSILTKGSGKSVIGHPDETVPVRSQLRRLRMRLVAIEYLADRLTFVRCKCRNEDERANSFVGARAYHSARIGMRSK